jgi:small-conductance mechanosensitive channel
MDSFLSILDDLIRDGITRLIGPANHEIFGGPITLADLGVSLCFLILTVLVSARTAVIIRRRTAKTEADARKAVPHHVSKALGKPLLVLIWLCGLYFAAAPLVRTATSGQELPILRQFRETAFDLGVFVLAIWTAYRLTHALDAVLSSWATGTDNKLDDLLAPLLGASLRIVLPVLGVIFALPILSLPEPIAEVVAHATSILMIGAIAAILFRAVRVFEKVILMRFDITLSDNLRARKVYTQIYVIRRVADVLIGLFAIASVLMLFSEVRQIGASLLASAGIVGVVAGFAAQKTIANLFAGFQIALAQPMRLDDVLVVEGEWGRVEEITLTYVVVRIWDDRRLVLPLSYFIEKPFQNWTRTSAELLGSIFVWVDYSFPVEQGREALKQIIEASPAWDKRFWNLQVTDANDQSLQLRILATSENSSILWNLRCEIREKFVAYIQAQHPEALPRLRVQRDGLSSGYS